MQLPSLSSSKECHQDHAISLLLYCGIQYSLFCSHEERRPRLQLYVLSKSLEDNETDVVILHPPQPNHPSKLYTCGYRDEFVTLALNIFPEFSETIALDAVLDLLYHQILQLESVCVTGDG